MPVLLRIRLALFVMFGVFLIPIGMSSLRGLTHIVSCSDQVAHPFDVDFAEDGSATLTGSTRVQAGLDPVCGSLASDLAVKADGPNRLQVTVPIENRGTDVWRGTVSLQVGGTTIPIRIGLVPPGETRSETIILRLPAGVTGFAGRLLIGP